MSKFAALIAAASLMGGLFLATSSQAGEHWKFKVINKSNTAALEFRTQEEGEWSKNWISDRIEPGDTFNMDFGTTEGDCTVRTQIRFTDGTYYDTPVDYCKVSNLYIYEHQLRWD
jgi:hypothetical protein